MASRKITELKDFVGKDFVLKCQKRGAEIFKDSEITHTDFAQMTLIGLISLLSEKPDQNHET